MLIKVGEEVKKKLICFLIATFLLVIPSNVAAVGINGSEATCGNGFDYSHSWIALYGDDNYQGGGGLFFCYSASNPGIPNLNAILQDSDDNCAGFGGVDFGRFENCVSSIRVNVQAYVACVYTDKYYGGTSHKMTGNITDLGGTLNGFDDAISSVKFILWSTPNCP